jgi:hypothetical protein
MSRVLSAAEICGLALGAIGAYPVNDTAPDGAQLRRSMQWLDLIMAQVAGTTRMFARVTPTTLTLALTNGTSTYDLYTALGSQLPADKIQYVIDIWLEDSAGNRHQVEIVTRDKFENVDKPTETGQPRWICIDHSATANPTLRIFPTPAATDTTSWSLKLVGQTYAPDVSPSGVLGTKPSSSVIHDFGQAWQRWLVLQLSHDLGAGPIHKLPEPSLNRFAGAATIAKTDLLAFENREHVTTPPVGDAPDGWIDDCGYGFSSDYGNRGWLR